MAERRSAVELAREWRKETMEFDDALIQHLEGNLGLVPDPALVLGISLAVSYLNMSQAEAILDLPGYPQMTAGVIVEKFGLTPFLDSETRT